MRRPDSPCRGCRRRAPGCHNGDTCPAWGRYQQALTDWNKMCRAAVVGQTDIDNYDKDRRRAARNKSNRKG